MKLKDAETIASYTLTVGRKNQLKPLTVAVFDKGGHLVCFKKEDGSSLYRQQIASGKALGALGIGIDSAKLGPISEARPQFMIAAYAASGGKLIPVAGGVLIKDKNGEIIGAVGVSGDISENDEACAVEGIKKAGLNCSAIEENRPGILSKL